MGKNLHFNSLQYNSPLLNLNVKVINFDFPIVGTVGNIEIGLFFRFGYFKRDDPNYQEKYP